MTQPAKAQEPSMEDILASIRRIIADDEAKPEAAQASERSPAPAARAAATEPAAKPKPAAPPRAAQPAPAPESRAQPAPAPVATNSQDDIDAMLAGLDAETTTDEVRPVAASAPVEDVLELSEMAVVDRKSAAAFRTVDPHNNAVEFSDPSPIHAPPSVTPEPPRPAVPEFEERVRTRVMEEIEPDAPRPLLSQSTVAAVDSAFNSLAQTVLSNNARTLEDLVKEMLRPMLKTWLDDNLPKLVEKIVRAEIERVSRGR
jgi:cell pole-organizing protein PopZ